MVSEGLTGTRIRERRQIAGLRQADLARDIGISASYLNLIEHNRRKIGGKLLLKIAQVLDVDSTLLSEGAEAALIGALREAEADAAVPGVELDRIEEFAGRFPGWARLVAATHARVGKLERTVDGLSDRLAHDPALAASIHEVLSTAASIRSTASILVETDALEPEWLNRFHANINEDSARLAESSRALAGYLEQGRRGSEDANLPQEEVDALLAARGYHFDELEHGEATVVDVVQASNLSAAARAILGTVLTGYAADVAQLPLDRLRATLAAQGTTDPVRLARSLEITVPVAMRRMACVPEIGAGYVMCDRSGSLLLSKPLPGFEIPRFGACCPLWPLFMAISQPGTVVRRQVVQLGRRQGQFDCFATTETVGATVYNLPPLVRSGMLIMVSKATGEAELTVGATCRVCPRSGCPGRREPSVLQESV